MTIEIYAPTRADVFSLEELIQRKKKDREPLPGESPFATMAVNHAVRDFNKIVDGALSERRALSSYGAARLGRLEAAISRLDHKQELGRLARANELGPASMEVSGQDMGGLLNAIEGTRRPVVLLGPRPEDFDDEYFPRSEVAPGVWRISDPDGGAVLWLLDGGTDPANLTFTQMATSLSPLLAGIEGAPLVLTASPEGPDLRTAVGLIHHPGTLDDAAATEDEAATSREDAERLKDHFYNGLRSMEDTILSFADTRRFPRHRVLDAAAARAAEKPHLFCTEAVVQVEYLTGPDAAVMIGGYRKSRAAFIPIPGSAGEILYNPYVLERLNAHEEERRMAAWRDVVREEGLTWDEVELRSMVQREIVEAPWQAVPGALTTSPGPGHTLLAEEQLRHLAATVVCHDLYGI